VEMNIGKISFDQSLNIVNAVWVNCESTSL
jgi:hypothetical protein